MTKRAWVVCVLVVVMALVVNHYTSAHTIDGDTGNPVSTSK